MPQKITLRRGLTPTQWDSLCRKCGECCRLEDRTQFPPKLLEPAKYCPHLIKKNGKFICKIYRKRVGTPLPDGGSCVDVQDCTHRAEHCPYNKFFGKSLI